MLARLDSAFCLAFPIMDTDVNEMLFQYPYPPRLRRRLIALFVAGMVTLVVALLVLGLKISGVNLSDAFMKRWLLLSFMVSFLTFGVMFIAIAQGVWRVNADRDGRSRKFIIPTKYGISESEKPLEYRLYAVFLFMLGNVFALISMLFFILWSN